MHKSQKFALGILVACVILVAVIVLSGLFLIVTTDQSTEEAKPSQIAVQSTPTSTPSPVNKIRSVMVDLDADENTRSSYALGEYLGKKLVQEYGNSKEFNLVQLQTEVMRGLRDALNGKPLKVSYPDLVNYFKISKQLEDNGGDKSEIFATPQAQENFENQSAYCAGFDFATTSGLSDILKKSSTDFKLPIIFIALGDVINQREQMSPKDFDQALPQLKPLFNQSNN